MMDSQQSDIPAADYCTCEGTVPVVRAYHELRCPAATEYDRSLYSQAMLADPKRAAVEMSGMSDVDLDELRREFG